VGWLDPLGWDRVVQRGACVYWETKGQRPLFIGAPSGDRVQLQSQFCGGCPTLAALQKLAESVFADRYHGHFSYREHRDLVKAILCGRARPNQVPSSTDAWLWGFSEGMDEGVQAVYPTGYASITIQHNTFSFGVSIHQLLTGGGLLYYDYSFDVTGLYGASLNLDLGKPGIITPYVTVGLGGRHGGLSFRYPTRRGAPVGAGVGLGIGIGLPGGVIYNPEFEEFGFPGDQLW